MISLVLILSLASPPQSLSGRVVDGSGGALAGASIAVECGDHRISAVSDAAGQYRLDNLPAERCQVTMSLDGFVTAQQSVELGPTPVVLDFLLAVRPFSSQIIVTPARGAEEDAIQVAQGAAVVQQADLQARPYTIITQALKEEAGVLAQQTTASQGSPILRGFTGQRNLYLLDGVRYNTSAWRDGPSQYVSWLPSAGLDRIEIVRGPASTQYGSDALGGTIGVFAESPVAKGPAKASGTLGLTLGAANRLRSSEVGAGLTTRGVALRLAASVGAAADLRAGGGGDSHSAVTRFLGLPSSEVGDTLENTGYTQAGVSAGARVPAGASRSVSLSYRHAGQGDSHRYDQEMGGNGRYRSEFGPQQLDFGFVRFESARQAVFDELSATVSVNRQADGRLEQARPGARIDEQFNTTTAVGYSVQATRALAPRFKALFGGEVYDEYIAGARTLFEPNGSRVAARPDIPDGTRYTSAGVFWQQDAEVIPGRLHVRGGLRYGRFDFSSRRDAAFGVPDESIRTADTTFNASGVYSVTPSINLTLSVNRGFRAANAFDFGAIGLSGGAGYEISPGRAAELRGIRGTTDGATAVSTDQVVGQLRPERLLAYEAGLRWYSGRASSSLTVFDLEFHDAIERRTLVFAADVVGQDLAGYPIIRQDAAGRAYVSGEARPVVTRVNVSRSRIRGFEADSRLRVTAALRARVFASMANGTELDLNTPRRRMPPATGGASLTWQPPSARWWLEGTVLAASHQDRLTDGDLGDARIGATRTAASIASYFSGTATDRGLVRDGRLVATGETLAQVQARVLGTSAVVPMFTATPGFVVFGARAGFPIGSFLELTIIGENLADRNYRLHGSGVDEPGLNVLARLRARF
ncbi:MAG: TonB-dependent receptor [Vicinamibacterales bacterium]|jgi:hemoglobin/transferrin/lactoferrin receptor protein